MITDWQEFDGGEFLERRVRARVTMDTRLQIYLGKVAFEALGRPEAVKLLFDVGGSRIGVRPVPRGEKTFGVVRRRDGPYGYVRANTFCRYYGIKPEAPIEFKDVGIDTDGIMVLDLKTARRIRR